jgi:hypothetical protein
MRKKYISLLISVKRVVNILTTWFKGLAAFAVFCNSHYLLIAHRFEVRHPRCVSQITKLYSRRLKVKTQLYYYMYI